MFKKRIFIISVCLFFYTITADCQALSLDSFNFIKRINSTAVSNQYRSNTCWSYTLLGMIETELLNERSLEISLSEMYLVYFAYIEKAERYIRMHGKVNFSEGGMLSDALDLIEKYGIVPVEAYSGLPVGTTLPDHLQLQENLKTYLDEILINKQIPLNWKDKYIEILNLYMGDVPKNFIYAGKEYTPSSFKDYLGIKASNYVLFMSFQYLPYYQFCLVEVPDNWNNKKAFNLPLSEFIAIIDNSILKGSPVAITCDISENGFMWNKGLAYAFENNEEKKITTEIIEQERVPSPKEISVNETNREESFDNFKTTDDHSLILTGIASDKNGRKYYYARNSWGTEKNPYHGYLFLSQVYLKYKSITALVKKQYISSDLLQKLRNNCE
jgi:bleomycin hydrolase